MELLKEFGKKFNDKNFKVMISKEELEKRIKELAVKISYDYKDKCPHLICILKGGIFFTCELAKNLTIDTTMDFMNICSYGVGARESTGSVKIVKDLDEPIEGKDILICEDIIDSGRTLTYLKEVLKTRKPKSIKICTMLNKQDRRVTDLKADYVAFEIEDKFILGYGLDYDQHLRNLPYIAYSEGE